jgi:arabinogalactan endo-1,4-beta-galactosidase
MVVETDWPASCSGVTMSESSIAISAAGQQAWVLGIKNVLAALTGSHGIGIIYWEPAWVRTFVSLFTLTRTYIFLRSETPVSG